MRMLSGGMKRRVLVAQALVHRPAGDRARQPTAGVDVGVAPGPVAVHPQAQPRRPHHRAHHALPGRSRNLVRTHRHAQGRAHRRPRHHRQPAAPLRHPQPCPCAWSIPRAASSSAAAPARAAGWTSPSTATRSRGLLARCAGWPAGLVEKWRLGEPDLERSSSGHEPCLNLPTPSRASSRWRPEVAARRLPHPVLQGVPAILEGQLPDRRCAGAHRVLFLLIFSHVLDRPRQVLWRRRLHGFLVPGLVMMSVLQNAFANSSSSLIQSKITGNIIFVLLPPISYREFLYRLRDRLGAARAMVGAGVSRCRLRSSWCRWRIRCGCWASPCSAARSSAARGDRRIWADKFDQLAAFQNFLIMPLPCCRRVLLHPFAAGSGRTCRISIPFFFMIDGFRYGFLAQSGHLAWLSARRDRACVSSCSRRSPWRCLRAGYKLRA